MTEEAEKTAPASEPEVPASAPDALGAPEREPEAPAAEKEKPRSSIADNAEVARGFKNAPVAASLIAVNVGVFAAQVYLAGGWEYALGMPDAVLRWLGANASLWTISDNRFETLVTSCFLHSSVVHLVLNMLVLWYVGPLLERAIGSARFFPLYLVAGVAGSAASAIWGRFAGQTVSVGASGALCGLIGAAVVVGVRTEGWRGELTVGMVRWLVFILLLALIHVRYPELSHVDNAAHFGGAIGGAIVAITWERGFTYARSSQRAVLGASVLVVIVCASVVAVRNRIDPYLFMNVDQRMKASYAARADGHCDAARKAMRRAQQMDPDNRYIRAANEETERECSDPTTDRPTPRIRQ